MTSRVAARNVVHWRLRGQIHFNGSSANDRFPSPGEKEREREKRQRRQNRLPSECTMVARNSTFVAGRMARLALGEDLTRARARAEEGMRGKKPKGKNSGVSERGERRKSTPYVENASQTDAESKANPSPFAPFSLATSHSITKRQLSRLCRVRSRQYLGLDDNSAITRF